MLQGEGVLQSTWLVWNIPNCGPQKVSDHLKEFLQWEDLVGQVWSCLFFVCLRICFSLLS